MPKFSFFLLLSFLSLSAFATVLNEDKIDREIEVKGFDIRMRSDQYTLFLGPENTLLEERPYKLMKRQGSVLSVVSEGNVISVDPVSQDQDELYKNPDVQIRLGKPVKVDDKTKQVIVFKFHGEGLSTNKAIAFENIQ